MLKSPPPKSIHASALVVVFTAAVGCAATPATTTTGGGGSGQGGGGDGGQGMGGSGGTDPYAAYAAKALHVSGNKILDTTGATVRLLGVNRAGTEYMCSTSTVGAVFDGSTGPNSITAMKSWHVNAVRLPLNESCWLGMSGTKVPAEQYQTEIEDYIQRLHAQGIYAILDLHWSTSGTGVATVQTTMAYAANAPAFWSSVATRFKDDPMVLFDLYNEPILDAPSNPMGGPSEPAVSDPWGCWQNGCLVNGQMTAGMQQLVNAVRGTGAKQIIIAGGIDWAHQLDQWLSHKPTDGQGNTVAGFHVYNRGSCADVNCWNGTPATVAASVPIITGELGEYDCQHTFIDSYMSWADGKGVSYLGWAWNPQNCSMFPALISNVDGTPTAFGQGLRDHLLLVNP